MNKISRRSFLEIAGVGAAAAALAACGGASSTAPAAGSAAAGSTAASGDPITIAFVGPQTGDNAEYGTTMKTAVQIAIEDWNAKGGVIGRQIQMVDYDDKNDATEAGTVAERIVSDKSVCAVIGHFSSGVAMAAASVYQDGGIALINGSAAHPDFAPIGNCIYRNNATYDTDANTMLQIMEYLGVSKFGILTPNTDAGVSVKQIIENSLKAYGDKYAVQLVAEETYDDGAVDFSAQVQNMKAAGCEAFYTNGAYAQAVPFLKQYLDTDASVKPVLSASCFSSEFVDAAGDYGEGIVLGTSFFFSSEEKVVQDFVAAYNEKTGTNPSTFCAQVYDAAYAIFQAIEAGNSAERADIVANLPATDFQGVSGKITFNDVGNCPKQQCLLTLKGGAWEEIPNVLLNATDWEAQL